MSTTETRPQVPAGGFDPSIKAPRAVVEAALRATEAQAAFTGVPVEPETPISGATPPAEPPVVVTPPGNPAEPPVVVATPPAEPPAVASPAGDDWENKFKALKGHYDHDTRQLKETNRGLAQQLSQLEADVAALKAAPPAPPENLVTPEEIAEYGAEFVDVVKRAAAEATAPLLREIGTLKAEVGTVRREAATNGVQRMHTAMNALLPNWEQLNVDQKFVDWVALQDPFSGAIRQKLMQTAWNSGDAERVAAFFKGFLAEEAAVVPVGGPASAPGTAPLAPVAPTAPVPRISLEDLAAPGRARSVAHTPTEKPTYTSQEISKFYTEVAAGKWRGREAERAAVDADISRAQHEGRILLNNRTVAPPPGFAR